MARDACARVVTEGQSEAPVAMALRAIDRPIGVVRSLGREKWQQVDPDVLHELGERITTLSARMSSDQQRLLMLIREFDRLEGWKPEGYGSCAAWLAHRTWMNKATAREWVRVARELGERPLIDEAMADGRLSFSQVRAMTRAPAEDEAELLEYAPTMTAGDMEKLVRSWGRLDREDEDKLAERVHRSRTLSIFPDEDGAYLIRGKVEPEVGALLMRAIEMASDAQYRGSVPETTPEQRRADALALLAERAMAVGFAGASAEAPEEGEAPEEPGTRDASAEAPPREERAPQSAARSHGVAHPERYTVTLHVHAEALENGADAASGPARMGPHPMGPHLEDGTRVSAEAARRLSCDAGVLRIVHRKGERLVEIQAKRRTIPLRLRRALELRDRGCRFPGCGSRFIEGHHIVHWAQGGRTELSNLLSLCKLHHHLLHEGGFRVEADPHRHGKPIFYSPRGYRIPEVPPQMTIDGKPVGRARAGADVGAATRPHRLPRWEHDVPLAFYLRTLDALCR